MRATRASTFALIVAIGLLMPNCESSGGGGNDGDGSGGCRELLAEWDTECFATEISGSVAGRGWNDIRSEFAPEVPDITAVIAQDGTLESVEGIPCELWCDEPGLSVPYVHGEFGEIHNILGTCRTHYQCGGYPLELSINGADVTPAWQGALWQLYAYSGKADYVGAPFEFGSHWNLGRANVPYEGCVPICEAVGAECGHDGCGGLCGVCDGAACDPATHKCGEAAPSCETDADCASGYCEPATSTCASSSCTDSGSCVSTRCCAGTTCVTVGNDALCLEDCTTPSQCASNCCYPLETDGSVCVTADYCANCAGPNQACSPTTNPCCPGAACIWVEGVGARCQVQSAECPAGCGNPFGTSCCRPPFCAGDCVGSPCCT